MVLKTAYLRILCLLLLLGFSSGSNAVYTLKFATLMPAGTAWSHILDDWVREIEEKSKKFRITYP